LQVTDAILKHLNELTNNFIITALQIGLVERIVRALAGAISTRKFGTVQGRSYQTKANDFTDEGRCVYEKRVN